MLSQPLGRREFFRRAAMTVVAGAAVGRFLGFDLEAALAQSVSSVPPLQVPEPVRGIVGTADGLLAVGGHDGAPHVWRYVSGDPGWSVVASPDAFPSGTSLLAVTSIGGRSVAAGSVVEALYARSVVNAAGEAVDEVIDRSAPAIFQSSDGSSWERVLGDIPGVYGGELTAVATLGSVVVAAGSRFLTAGVREGYGAIAAVSRDGRAWRPIVLRGVTVPMHGSITLLGAATSAFVLATVGFSGSTFYSATDVADWKVVGSPTTQRVSYLAAAPIEGGLLLAGVDEWDRPRYFVGTGTAWTEVGVPAPLTSADRLTALAAAGGMVMAASAEGSTTTVEQVEV